MYLSTSTKYKYQVQVLYLTPTLVYIDLSKALDALTFDVLLYKLKYYGITDTALDLMKSCLTNRKQHVVFDSCLNT